MTVINHGGQCPVQLRILGVNRKCSQNFEFLWAFIQILFRLEYGELSKNHVLLKTIFSGPYFGVRSNSYEGSLPTSDIKLRPKHYISIFTH